MKRIKKVQETVQFILETQPETRNSDDVLLAKVFGIINKDCLMLPFSVVLTNRKTLGLPSIKSVDRCRRKLQRAYPELRASKEVEAFREEEQLKYENYGKMVCL